MLARALRVLPLALLLGAAAPQGCVPGATRGGASCDPSYPQGVKGPVRTLVHILYTNDLCRWNQEYIDTATDYHRRMIQDSLAKAAAANPNGPQYQFVGYGQPAGLWLSFMVTGQTHSEEDPYDEGQRCVGDAWIYMQADGQRSRRLFSFSTASYKFYSNAYGLGAYQEASDRASSFLNNGWTCN